MTVRVRVPATSANLGPGFDTAGLALARYDEVEASVVESGLRVDVEGIGADSLPRTERHLVVRAARAAFEELGGQPAGFAVRCRNAIPHGRGLGSSAAAIVAGVVAARALHGCADPAGAEALPLAARLEGHPDNIAACLLGGVTFAWTDADGTVDAARFDPAPDLTAVALVPPFGLSTRRARGLLPAQVPHADAAANAARAALLAPALTGRLDLLRVATEDRLHQAYREPAMPDTLRLVAALRAAGHAAVVSGAGPAVLVLGSAQSTASARTLAVAAAPDWDVVDVPMDGTGAVVL
ncbi:MAG: homoserine kinase [Streptosporangiales bacterium]|nr:homoserine kinase [Streptosporangiales bacterium]